LIYKAQQSRVRADTKRIPRSNLCSGQDRDTRGLCVYTARLRTARAIVDVAKSARPKMRKRNNASVGDPNRVASTFIVEEEKQLVADDSSAKAAAELIALQVRSRRFQIAGTD
jgi:hypothetical protein